MTANEHPLMSGNLYALLTPSARQALLTVEVAYIAVVREFGENSYEARAVYRLHQRVLRGLVKPESRQIGSWNPRGFGPNERQALARRIWRRLFGAVG